MRLLGIYIGAMLSIVLGAGAFFFQEDIQRDKSFDVVAECEARGGSWVHDAEIPLCMTPNEGLLQFVEGEFIPFLEGSDLVMSEEKENDPWEQDFTPLLAGKDFVEEKAATQKMMCTEQTMHVYEGTHAKVDFSSWPDATKYKTAITKDVAHGINFAGSYVVSTWGCAKNRRAQACVGHAIVDVRTGEIVLYDVVGKQVGDFSQESNMFSVILQNGEEKVWSVEGDELVACPE